MARYKGIHKRGKRAAKSRTEYAAKHRLADATGNFLRPHRWGSAT